MIEIQLTRGLLAIIDDADLALIDKHKWHALRRPDGKFSANTNIGLGYYRRRQMLMHRLIMDAPPNLVVDHINGNPLDNRRTNLRLCSQKENTRNKRTNKKKTKGIYFIKRLNKFQANIGVDGKLIYLGVFSSEKEASDAYDAAAITYFGEYANLNRF